MRAVVLVAVAGLSSVNAGPSPGNIALRPDPASEPQRAVIHDNDRPAGRLVDGVLHIHLRAVQADWRPLGDDQPGAVVFAFAEGVGAPMIPSPLLRTTVGTRVRVTIENALDSTLIVHGLTERVLSAPAAVVIPPGQTRHVEFTADAEGTYPYWGRVVSDAATATSAITDREYADVPLSGALRVDPAVGAPAGPEEIMVITAYRHRYSAADTTTALLQTINGRPWPFTKRMRYTQGDSVRWRIVNAAERGHPMHLHGFYYRIDAKGDIARDTIYWAAQRRMAVTEEMAPGSTLDLTWSPDRPGGWVFHCHISFHVLPNAPLGTVPRDGSAQFASNMLGDPHHDPSHHVEQGMGGLMMAIDVEPSPGWKPDERERRVVRALIVSDSTPAPVGAPLEFTSPYRRRFSLVVQKGDVEPSPNEVPFPGEPLILREGEPTTIWVVNRTAEPTAIHWHGLELESLFDGVVGVGGYLGSRTPPVLPGDSFQVRITPPRAGSFMYHTHMSDLRQQGGGLYGPFVVLGRDEQWDPEHDRILLLGNGPHDRGVFLNGSREAEPTAMKTGEAYRLRFMNISLGNNGTRARLVFDGFPVQWLPIAKDGADLPPAHRIPDLAEIQIRVGEVEDYEFVPQRPGEYILEIRGGNGNLFASQTIKVTGPPVENPGG